MIRLDRCQNIHHPESNFSLLAWNQESFGGNNLDVNRSKDNRLLARISRGDQKALADLYDSHARLLAFRLRRDGASQEETEDVLQETFLDVWKSAESFRGDSEVAGWLWGMASRKYRMLVRGEIRMRHREERSQSEQKDDLNDDGWAFSIDTGEAISRLSPDLREAFEAVALQGLSVAEASESLGAPEGTIKSRVHRARQALRKELQ